jgi:hypothetical protein
MLGLTLVAVILAYAVLRRSGAGRGESPVPGL